MKSLRIKFTGKWLDTLIWCPSQLEREFKANKSKGVLKKHTRYDLYCRWRYEDPWTFSIIYPDPEDFTKNKLIRIGEGLTKETPIEEVHKFAENLLIQFYTKTSL